METLPAACGFFDILCRMDAHQGQAAWAQAVLSAAAVFFSVWLQDRSYRRRENSEALEWIRWVERIAVPALALAQDWRRRTTAEPPTEPPQIQEFLAGLSESFDPSQKALVRLRKLLRAVHVRDAPTIDAADAYLDVRGALIDFESELIWMIRAAESGAINEHLVPEIGTLEAALAKLRFEAARFS